VSPREVKREIKKLIYEKPILIVLGDTLTLGTGKCQSGSYDAGTCSSVGHSAATCQPTGYGAITKCQSGTWKA